MNNNIDVYLEIILIRVSHSIRRQRLKQGVVSYLIYHLSYKQYITRNKLEL